MLAATRNLVRNRKLAKSISDAGSSAFPNWLEYFGKVFGVVTVRATDWQYDRLTL
ncbi:MULTISPECIES: hypothetical protein [unclassified Microcoleus]|uniref:hypothetical protein n=1 Tax=unclassified Microcoleus TaxID=2642155 RepID=UPI002FD6E0F6